MYQQRMGSPINGSIGEWLNESLSKFFWHGTGRTQLLSSFFVHMMVRIALDKGNTRRYIACYFWPPLESISPLTTCSPGSLSDSSQAFSPVQSYAVAVMVASAISSLD